MQYINHWPNMVELALPEPVAQDLHLHKSVFLYLIHLFKPQQYQPNHLLTLAYNHSKSNEL